MQGNSTGSLVVLPSTAKISASASISPSTVAPSSVADRETHVAARCASCRSNDSDGSVLHRLKQDGAVRHHCSSCILSNYKDMYCSQCFQTYSDPNLQGDTSMWVSRYKSQRLGHLTCTRYHAAKADSLAFKCQYCKEASTVKDGSPLHKKVRLIDDLPVGSTGFHSSNDDLCVLEAFAAAQIVVMLAARRAKNARARARSCAADAVKAADRAKNALDSAHRAAREELKWKAEFNRQLVRDTQKSTTAMEFAMVTASDNTTPQLREMEVEPKVLELQSSTAADQHRGSLHTKKPEIGHVNVDGSASSKMLKDISAAGDGSQINAQKITITPFRNGTTVDTGYTSNGVSASTHADVSLESKDAVNNMLSLAPELPKRPELTMVGTRNDKSGKVSDNSVVSSKNSSVAAISNTEPRNAIDDCSASLQSSKEHTLRKKRGVSGWA